MAGPFDAYQDAGFNPGFAPAVEPDHKHGTFGALLSSAATNVAPTAGGIAAFPAGAGAGAIAAAPLDPFTFGGASVVGGLVGGTAAAMGGSAALAKMQDFLVSQLPKSATKGTAFDPDVQAEDQANHPVATTIGSLLPQAVFLRPGWQGFRAAAVGAGIGGGVEAGNEYEQGQGYNPVKIGANALFGAFLNTETRAGRLTGAGGKVAADAMLRAIPAARAVGARAGAVYADSLAGLPQEARDAAVAASIRAGTVGDRATSAQVNSDLSVFHPENDISTPDEKAALHTASRENDAREASPLHPDPQGAGANADRLAAMEAWLGVTGRAAPDIPSPAPLPGPLAHPDLTTAVIKAEGVGKNPHSSAEGYGQFTRGTWLNVYRRNFGGDGMTDAQVLALRNDPTVGAQMTETYGRENAAGLRRAGLEDSAGNLSLAHFLGLGGARDVLRADPHSPVEAILPAKVIAANERVLRGKTAADVIAWAHKRIGGATGEQVARGDAVPQWDYVADAVPEGVPDIHVASFRPDEIGGEQQTFYHGSPELIDEWRTDKGGTGVISVSSDRQFAAHYAGPDGVIHELQVAPGRYGDFRNETDVQAMIDANRKGFEDYVSTWGAKEAAKWTPELRAKREAEFVGEDDIRHGEWRRWEQPDLWKQLGWDGAYMREGRGEFMPDTINLAVADPQRIRSIDDTPYSHVDAGRLTVWEGSDGSRIVVDGAKRLSRAKRAGVESVDAHVLRESDGVTLDQAREIGRLKNEADAHPDHVAMRAAAALPNDRFGDLLNGRERDGAVSGPAGRKVGPAQADSELADGRGLPRGATPYDDAVRAEQHTAGFSDPAADAVTQQVQSLEHDLLMDPDGSFRLNDEGEERTIPQILEDADADLQAVEKARACLAPPAAVQSA